MAQLPGIDRRPIFGTCTLCRRFQFRVYRYGDPDRPSFCCWPCVIVAYRWKPPTPLDDEPKGK